MHAAAAPPPRAAPVAAATQMQAAVGTAVVEKASYTVVAAATSEAVEPLPRTAAQRKQHPYRAAAGRARAAVTRRIEPLRDPVDSEESDEPEMVAPAQKGQGLLQVNSRPWARVLLDGRFVGHTPQLGLRVSPGKHHILLVNEQMDMHKAFDVTVPAGETVSRVVLLDDDPSEDP